MSAKPPRKWTRLPVTSRAASAACRCAANSSPDQAGSRSRCSTPMNVWPVPLVTFPILVWLIDGSAGGRFGTIGAAAAVGWWFGFGYFLAGLYWLGNAFLVDAKTFGWLLPFAVIALPAGLAML